MLGRPMRARSRPLLFGLVTVALGMAMSVSALAKPKGKAAPKKPVAAAPEKTEAPAPKVEETAKPGEPPVKGAPVPKEGTKDAKGGKVTTVEESGKDKGVKTYKFSAVEVEGRLKSPQIAYFLRRVRAEFEAGDLGHRSFVPELKDTRRSPSLR
jgi:hypothetical protein